jgi:hypothetical protein
MRQLVTIRTSHNRATVPLRHGATGCRCRLNSNFSSSLRHHPSLNAPSSANRLIIPPALPAVLPSCHPSGRPLDGLSCHCPAVNLSTSPPIPVLNGCLTTDPIQVHAISPIRPDASQDRAPTALVPPVELPSSPVICAPDFRSLNQSVPHSRPAFGRPAPTVPVFAHAPHLEPLCRPLAVGCLPRRVRPPRAPPRLEPTAPRSASIGRCSHTMASASFRESMNSLGWSRRDPDMPVNTSSSTPLLSRLQSLNPFADRGYVRLPTHDGPGAPLPAPTRREEEEAWFARKSLLRHRQCHSVKQHLRKLPELQGDNSEFLRWPRAHRMRPAAARLPPAAPWALFWICTLFTDPPQSVAGSVSSSSAASTSPPPSSSPSASCCCLRPSSSPRPESSPSCK